MDARVRIVIVCGVGVCFLALQSFKRRDVKTFLYGLYEIRSPVRVVLRKARRFDQFELNLAVTEEELGDGGAEVVFIEGFSVGAFVLREGLNEL